MNTVAIIGNLCREPELVNAGDTPICKMRVAVSRAGGKDQSGFFNVTAFARQAELCMEYLSKGSKVGVEGRLQWREWESDAGKREAIEIVAGRVDFLSGASETPSGEKPTSDEDIPF